MFKQTPYLISVLAFFTFIKFATSVTNSPIWKTSEYIQAGSYDLISSLTTSNETPTHNFTFVRAFSGIPMIGYGLRDYEGKYS